ncbi:MAG: hypothetical protein LBE56_13810, partial [Tannerella sp.]|nr:hypothetical protein [Tannerella sp.]
MKTLIKLPSNYIIALYNVFLLTCAFSVWMTSCETEYIPDGTEEEPVSVLLANEGNFKLDIRFADFGEGDLLPES